ncbi:unnamed protein product [Clavelina lepadiformis]|uniref:Aldehyde dehydrogenase domain-containing protein n=1 Tax=Clavelina lepadiformis TaxID=159417 RepID=A0ABP0F461_CLALP
MSSIRCLLKKNLKTCLNVNTRSVLDIFSSRAVSSGNFVVTEPLNFINGHRVECKDACEQFQLEEPATGDVICNMDGSGQRDVDEAVRCAKEAQLSWRATSGFERSKIILKAANLLAKRKEEMARIEVYDTGKPIWEARADVQTAIDSLEYFGGIASALCGQHITLPSGSFGYTRREPLGVIGAIGAWNFPIQMAGWKSAPALACGNAVVYKPSQFAPLSTLFLGEVFQESGLPPGLYNVIQGGAYTGQLLTSHEDIAKVTFTGSVQTGAKVMKSCADGIKYVTLELGGKSPLILFDDCDLESAVNATMGANYLSQGQVCSNATRVFIHENIYNKMITRLIPRVKSIVPGDPHHEDTQTGPMINTAQAEKVLGFIERAKKEGAEVLCGGELVTMENTALKGSYISPCIIRASDEMEISREEVFGPVMNVYSFQTEEEVLMRGNNTDFGLAAGVFTRDLNRAHRIAAKLEAGNCFINNFNVYPVELPFGGYKKSGIGKENGTQTIEYFTQLKSVYVEANPVEKII